MSGYGSLPSSRIDRSRHLEATTSARTRRYDPTELHVRRHLPISTKVQKISLPRGWIKCIHPEGKPYYYHPGDHIVTENNVELKRVHSAIEYWRDRILAAAQERGMALTSATEIMIDLDFSTKPEKCLYYLIDWDERREFWCEDVDTAKLGMDMAFSSDHLELAIEELFWTHVEYFSMHHPIPDNAVIDLIAALTHAATDQLTSELSTAPWSASECERFLKLLSNLPRNDGIRLCIVARLWRTILHSQFINLYGHPGARLSRNQSILSEFTPLPSPRLTWISRVLLFGAPEPHLETLRDIWIDKVVYSEHWGAMIKALTRDWTAVAVMGILLVIVNITLISNTVDEGFHRYVCFTSTMFGLSSAGSAVLLLRRHRDAERFNAFNAGAYLEDTHHPHFGHQPLAIVYSLPYALFLWSLTTLALALLATCYSSLSPELASFSPTAVISLGGLCTLASVLYWSMIGFWRQGGLIEGWTTEIQRWAWSVLARSPEPPVTN